MPASTTSPDYSDIQGLLIRGFTHPCSCHLLFQFGSGSGTAAAFIKSIYPWVQSAAPWGETKPSKLINISLTYSGIQKVTPSPGYFPAEFIAGPTADASQLSLFDLGPSDPSNWTFGNSAHPVDCIVHAYALTPADLDALVNDISSAASANGLTEILPAENGTTRLTQFPLEPNFIHFGYRDGIDQPDLNVSLDTNSNGYTDPQNLNNFLIGYGNQFSAFPVGWSGADKGFANNGVFNAFRMFYQDAQAFDKFLSSNAPLISSKTGLSLELAEEWLAAKIVGRWRPGSPLVLSPDHPDPSTATSTVFEYASDPKAARCPFSSHTRVSNPRDTELNPGFTVPRIVRRGVPYGSPVKGGNYAGDRGLVGIFLCGTLGSQFELLNSWINLNNFSPVYGYPMAVPQDALLANRKTPMADSSFSIEIGGETVSLKSLKQFVVTRGTAYCLLPSLSSLRSIFTA